MAVDLNGGNEKKVKNWVCYRTEDFVTEVDTTLMIRAQMMMHYVNESICKGRQPLDDFALFGEHP